MLGEREERLEDFSDLEEELRLEGPVSEWPESNRRVLRPSSPVRRWLPQSWPLRRRQPASAQFKTRQYSFLFISIAYLQHEISSPPPPPLLPPPPPRLLLRKEKRTVAYFAAA